MQSTRSRLTLFLSIVAVAVFASGDSFAIDVASAPREGYTKAVVRARLFAQPNASAAPAIGLLDGVDGAVLHEYSRSTLISVNEQALPIVRERSRQLGIEFSEHPQYDTIHVNGHVIDARRGTERSIPGARFDSPYPSDELGNWIIQFRGPIVPEWEAALATERIVLVQYLPFNAYIVAGRESAIRRAAALPFVQFVEQMHRFVKPGVVEAGPPRELWIQVAETDGTEETLKALAAMSSEQIDHQPWSRTERRVVGTFRADAIGMIMAEPLVVAVTERPAIRLSDERVSLSLTDLQPGTGAVRYKKWLADICGSCSNLAAEGYRIGIADTGLDGGDAARQASGAIPGEPASSGSHRSELAASRIIWGQSFAQRTGTWPGLNNEYPDTTETKHDVYGHGTLVAGIAAGDPGSGGSTDSAGFLWGVGVAPSAGLVITKIDHSRIGAPGAAPVRDVTKDAYASGARVQNHSYNQYVRKPEEAPPEADHCWSRFDGLYSTLSRDFDFAVRDSDNVSPGNQPIFLTVSAGNVDPSPFNRPPSDCPDRFHTLPPATAKNVLAVGMAESHRPDSHAWTCLHADSSAYDNVASSGKTGTAFAGWFKPDLMAPATNVASTRSHDIDPPQAPKFCPTFSSPPALPTEYVASTGTSFAAPVAAGAALLASRLYAARVGGTVDSASPALLKAMLIAGAASMRGGRDRSRYLVWQPNNTIYREGDLVIPRFPNGHVYRCTTPGIPFTCASEPIWPTNGGSVTEACSGGATWQDMGAEDALAGLPNSRQGFGRLSLATTLSEYPARDFVANGPALVSGDEWSRSYKVHDGGLPVRIALVWTDEPAAITSGSHLTTAPLVNNLDLVVELSGPCVRYTGNNISNDESQPDPTCSSATFDALNNVEVVRFFATPGRDFSVIVRASCATGGGQDFALVVFNAYRSDVSPPPGAVQQFTATAASMSSVSLSWLPPTGAASYEIQRSSGVDDPFVTLSVQSGVGYQDSTAAASQSYLYRVRARNSTGSSPFAVDVATTVLFDDDPIAAGITRIRAVHLTQLRSAISALRAAAGLPPYSWSDATVVPQQTRVLAAHLSQLRAATDQARAALGLASSAYGETIVANQTRIRATHLTEIRERLK